MQSKVIELGKEVGIRFDPSNTVEIKVLNRKDTKLVIVARNLRSIQ